MFSKHYIFPRRRTMRRNWIVVFLIIATPLLSFFIINKAQAATTTLTVTKTADTNDGACDTDCSLREAIAAATSGDTINFASDLSGQTITLDSSLGHLNIGKNLTIDGSSLSSSITISGGGATRVFWTQSSYTFSLISLNVINGAPASGQVGGGIANQASLTLTEVVLSGNTSTSAFGGAIYNFASGAITITNSTLENNTASGSSGGAIYNIGTITIGSSTISTNTASSGAAIFNTTSSGNLTITDSTFTDNNTTLSNGGAIYNSNSAGLVTISRSTFTGNDAVQGAAIYNAKTLTLANSTFGSNTASSLGGAIYNASGGSLDVTNNTFSANNAASGGAIYNAATLALKNTILANSLPSGTTDCYNTGTINTDVNNLIETNASGSNACGTPVSTDDPILASLAAYGGTTSNFALLPGSPALDAGDNTICAASPVNNIDQRGKSRPMGGSIDSANDVCDIGAFESTGFWLYYWSYDGQHGGNQSTPINSLFNNPLGVKVYPLNSKEPAVGGILDFTAPTTGASATISETITLVSGTGTYGYAQVDVTANGNYGIYNVNINGNGLWTYSPNSTDGLDYELTNCNTSIVVQNTNDSDEGSLREALKCACPNQVNTVTFNSDLSGETINLASQLEIDPNRTVTIDGSALASPVTISGDSEGDGDGDTRVLIVEDNVNATLNGLTITRGNTDNGGGVFVAVGGSLTVTNSTISQNTASGSGGGIYMVDGANGLTIIDSTITSNTSEGAGGAIAGIGNTYDSGGCTILKSAPLIITNSVIDSNSSANAGVSYEGTLTITGSTVSNNYLTSGSLSPALVIYEGHLTAVGNTFYGNGISSTVTAAASAIYYAVVCNQDHGVLINNNTFSGNDGSSTVLVSAVHGTATIVNNTFTGNSGSSYGVDLRAVASVLNLYNNIFANSNTPEYNECGLGITTFNQANNLIEGAAGDCTAAFTADPGLEDLADNGGATQTHALSPSSPAVDAGDDANCPTTDQRGVTRSLDGDDSGTGGCDLGAFELGELACGIQNATEPYPSYTMDFSGGVAAQVTNDGSDLECLRVTPFEVDHPNATSAIQTGKYWLIEALQSDKSTEATTDYSANLTLPQLGATNPRVCKYPGGLGGAGWDCSVTNYDGSYVWREGISSFSDWAVGDSVSPTSITFGNFAPHNRSLLPIVWGMGLLGLFSLGAVVFHCFKRGKIIQ